MSPKRLQDDCSPACIEIQLEADETRKRLITQMRFLSSVLADAADELQQKLDITPKPGFIGTASVEIEVLSARYAALRAAARLISPPKA